MKYGMLEVIGLDPDRKYHMLVRCECGTEKSVAKGHLVSGNTKSCGCAPKVDGSELKGTPTHNSWTSMLQRIRNPDYPDYCKYGGRGLRVDPAWEKFENFYADMGQRPEGKTLERLNTNGDYCKTNCMWATAKEQNDNRRNSIRYPYRGHSLSINQLMEIFGAFIPDTVHATSLRSLSRRCNQRPAWSLATKNRKRQRIPI